MNSKILILVFLIVLTVGCGGGSDSDGSGGNSCSVLNLRVSNGDNCNANGSPVVPVLISFRDGHVASCTGTFISRTAVLTAAHCVLGDIAELQVITPSGVASLSDGTIPNVYYDSRYAGAGRPDVPYDFAVIKTSFAVNVSPIPILASSSIAVGERFTVFGYGLDENNQTIFDRARSGDLDTLLKAGEMEAGGLYSNNLIFTATFNSTNQSACPGDSGGPAIVRRNGISYLAGVVSFGTVQTCQLNSFAAFGNLSESSVHSAIVAAVPDASIQ